MPDIHFLTTKIPDGLNLARNKHYRGSVPTKFMSENETQANEAWDAIEAGHGDVAIEPEYAAERGLPPTILHPRDPSKLLYIIESYHAIHCLVCAPSFITVFFFFFFFSCSNRKCQMNEFH